MFWEDELCYQAAEEKAEDWVCQAIREQSSANLSSGFLVVVQSLPSTNWIWRYENLDNDLYCSLVVPGEVFRGLGDCKKLQ